jgi:hypothetical protein
MAEEVKEKEVEVPDTEMDSGQNSNEERKPFPESTPFDAIVADIKGVERTKWGTDEKEIAIKVALKITEEGEFKDRWVSQRYSLKIVEYTDSKNKLIQSGLVKVLKVFYKDLPEDYVFNMERTKQDLIGRKCSTTVKMCKNNIFANIDTLMAEKGVEKLDAPTKSDIQQKTIGEPISDEEVPF